MIYMRHRIKAGGYQEWITIDGIGFITNAFGRVLYVNRNWPEGRYEKWVKNGKGMLKTIREHCKEGRSFTKEDLMLELL